MALTAGYLVSCTTSNCVGGVKSIYLANQDDLDTTVGYELSGFTLAAGVFTTVTMDLGKVFYRFEGQDFTLEFRENAAPTPNGCGQVVTQELELTFPCNTTALRTALDEIFSSVCCGVVAIVEKFDGTFWAVGYLDKRHLKLLSTTATSGKALADAQNTVLVLQAITTELSTEFTGTVPV